mmetsp:Transcript_7259/g.13445  ORF Transcript_7259/g.13445 Transcript_7259/m.13445 type:complete len:351 (-) Transcript_7259:68-1120(-)
MSESLKAIKVEHIKEKLALGDVQALRHLCRTPFGLVSTKLRKEVWPLLMGVTPDYFSDWRSHCNTSKYEKIITQDVNRSFVSLDIVDNDSSLAKIVKRRQLNHILNAVFSLDDSLNYYQGYNEICSIFFLVAGEDEGFKLSMKAAEHYLKDCMRATFDDGFLGAMKSIYTLVRVKEPQLYEAMSDEMPEMPSPCVSWILAWFSQKLTNFDAICRIFDFFLANHALAPVYLTAVILIELKISIFALSGDEGTTHTFLHKVLLHLDWDCIIEKSSQLMEEYPPEQLISETPYSFSQDSPYLYPSNIAPRLLPRAKKPKSKEISSAKLFLAGAAAATVGFIGISLLKSLGKGS